jgi:hypothetical protein
MNRSDFEKYYRKNSVLTKFREKLILSIILQKVMESWIEIKKVNDIKEEIPIKI